MKRETFEKRDGTDNQYDVLLGPGNLLDPDFSNPGLPSSWGEQSGRHSHTRVQWCRKRGECRGCSFVRSPTVRCFA